MAARNSSTGRLKKGHKKGAVAQPTIVSVASAGAGTPNAQPPGAANAPAVPPGALPSAAAPVPPNNYTVTKLPGGTGPRRAQLGYAGFTANELASSKTVGVDFDNKAPVAELAQELAVAAAWSVERIHAAAWLRYAKSREAAAWGPTMGLVAHVQPAFEYALAHDATIGERYPSAALFFTVRKASAARGASTKKKAKKTAGTGQLATAVTPAAPAQAAPLVTGVLGK